MYCVGIRVLRRDMCIAGGKKVMMLWLTEDCKKSHLLYPGCLTGSSTVCGRGRWSTEPPVKLLCPVLFIGIELRNVDFYLEPRDG